MSNGKEKASLDSSTELENNGGDGERSSEKTSELEEANVLRKSSGMIEQLKERRSPGGKNGGRKLPTEVTLYLTKRIRWKKPTET